MLSIADSSYVIALLTRRDRNHASAVRLAQSLRIMPWLPAPALTEICYLLQDRVGRDAPRHFLESLADPRAGFQLLDPGHEDYVRTAQILGIYADSGVDYVDALIVAVSERLRIRTVLTFDRRHFGLVRPLHCPAFDLLPEALELP